MDTLPQELLHDIFIQLPITQKQECMFVCQKWRNIIQSRSLFHTVFINSFELLKRFTLLLKQEPHIVFQVEILFLYRSAPRELDKRMFTVFPNLKEIRMQPIYEGILKSPNDYIFNKNEFEGLPFTDDVVRHIHDFDECELTRLLITCGRCSHLTTLKLNLNVLGSSPSDIFPLLKGMPVLKRLSLTYSPVTMDSIEAIHTNIPSLESMKLSSVKLLPGRLPEAIVPVTLLTKLDILSSDPITQGKPDWFKYILKKYTHLKHFDFTIPSYFYNSVFREAYSSQLPLILQNLGPQLESLVLSDYLDKDYKILNSMDHYGCQIKNLNLTITDDENTAFDVLTRTKQFKLIEKLSLSTINFTSTLEKLKEMEKLESLKLTFHEYEPDDAYENEDRNEDLDEDADEDSDVELYYLIVNFDTLFQYFPESLHSVDIECACLEYDDLVQGDYSQIKKLTVRDANPCKRIDEFISKRLPNLESLTLYNFYEIDRKITLPNHHLTHLCITEDNNPYINLCLVTKNDDNTRYYSTFKSHYKNYSQLDSVIPPITIEDLDGQLFTTIVCKSVDTLVLGFKNALLTSNSYEFQSLTK